MTESLTGTKAVRDAIAKLMRKNGKVLTYGLGVNDPGKVFGTTQDLLEEFGPERVFETPTSELGATGVGVGLAIAGFPVIHSHQRMDFALLAMDQLVNSAAKWKFMFGDQFSVPYLTRMIIGRGWGQGPTHSQNLESWLAHTPGIRVLVPATPQDLNDSIAALEKTEDPIVLIEHRWIHGVIGPVEKSNFSSSSTLIPVIYPAKPKPALTIVTWGLATFDCLAAKNKLEGLGLNAEVVQLRELSGESFNLIAKSLEVSGHMLVVSNSWGPASFADSVVSYFARQYTKSPERARIETVQYPHEPEPTNLNQLQGYHVSDWRVVNAALSLVGRTDRIPAEDPVDQPQGYDFGPF